MTNHPNRSGGSPGATPTPAAIKEAREAAGLTQTSAAALIYSSLRTWQQWEAGDRRMHPGLFELFSTKTTEPQEWQYAYEKFSSELNRVRRVERPSFTIECDDLDHDFEDIPHDDRDSEVFYKRCKKCKLCIPHDDPE